jgi:hypothetical protein
MRGRRSGAVGAERTRPAENHGRRHRPSGRDRTPPQRNADPPPGGLPGEAHPFTFRVAGLKSRSGKQAFLAGDMSRILIAFRSIMSPLASAAVCAATATALCCALAAHAQSPFDGSWNVVVVCGNAPDGARGYTWQFPAQVRDGSLLGQYRQPGNIPSGTLSGSIQANGDAFLKMVGLTGSPEHTLAHMPSGMPFGYTVTAHFTGDSGSGKRNELRACALTFTKS